MFNTIDLGNIKGPDRIEYKITIFCRNITCPDDTGYFTTYWNWTITSDNGNILTGIVTTQYDTQPLVQDILVANINQQVALLAGYSLIN